MTHSNHLLEELKIKLSVSKDMKSLERNYYDGLANCLKLGNFDSFRKLFDASVDFNIFIEVKKIPKRFELISKLILDCTERISTEYQTSALGEQIDILRFCNEFNLFEKELTEAESILIEKIRADNLFIANLIDLFGRVTDSFISYVYSGLPRDLYDHFMSRSNEYFSDREQFMHYIKNNFFNQYTIYGLSVRYLSSKEQFIDTFKKYYYSSKNLENREQSIAKSKGQKFIEFNVIYRTIYYGGEEDHEYREIKKHFVSPDNILRNLDNIMADDNYNFYSISMVLLGGLGPQGLGFTYSTPKGEIIEICSDQKESEAIIIKFKQFLRNKFLSKLDKELSKLGLIIGTRQRIIDFLSEILSNKEIVNYYDRDSILKKIRYKLYQIDGFQQINTSELEDIINKISKAVTLILRKIKLKDQFITRMDLVEKGKIKSEDIAKLTSLKGKSHYDVLRERFFYQYIVDWFYEIFIEEKEKLHKKNSKITF